MFSKQVKFQTCRELLAIKVKLNLVALSNYLKSLDWKKRNTICKYKQSRKKSKFSSQ